MNSQKQPEKGTLEKERRKGKKENNVKSSYRKSEGRKREKTQGLDQICS